MAKLFKAGKPKKTVRPKRAKKLAKPKIPKAPKIKFSMPRKKMSPLRFKSFGL